MHPPLLVSNTSYGYVNGIVSERQTEKLEEMERKNIVRI